MNLLDFIELERKKHRCKMSKSSSQKDAAFQSALGSYLKGEECSVNRAITSDFIYGFGSFLAKGYEKRYSASTCREILRTLRMYLRMVMLEGSVPNIDAVPSVIAQLDSEFWHSAADGKSLDRAASRQEFGVKESVGATLRHIDTWTTKRRMSADTKTDDRAERTVSLQNKCAAIYLFCIMTCGMEIRDALAIKCDVSGAGVPDSVYVERYGMNIPLSPTAKKLVETYNQGAVCTDHLFFTLDNGKYKGDLDNAAKLVEGHIAKYFLAHRVSLFKKRSVFIDWLNLAMECGLSDVDAESLWRYRLGELPASAVIAAVERAQSSLGITEGALDESWYLLSMVSVSVKRDKFLHIFFSSGILGDECEARKRVYAPEERLRDKERGEHAVLGRYIFFRGTHIQAEFANSFSPYAYVVKDMSRRRLARIPESELRDLQVMLRDFPDAVELIDGDKWLEEHNAKIVKGCKAIIRSGSLAGKEAKVVEIKGGKTGRRTYFIEYVEGAIRFQTNLEGIQLDIIPARGAEV